MEAKNTLRRGLFSPKVESQAYREGMAAAYLMTEKFPGLSWSRAGLQVACQALQTENLKSSETDKQEASHQGVSKSF